MSALAIIFAEEIAEMKRIIHNLFLGSLIAVLISGCGEEDNTTTTESTTDSVATSGEVPKAISYTLVAAYPHDTKAFTEGLEYIDGHIYESTGKYGESDIRQVDLQTGKILRQQKLEAKYFGEGITILNGKIYQLTYQEKTGFVYDLKTMKLLQTFSFTNSEGWGMTNDGTNLIYSDGTSMLYYLDPVTLKEVKHIEVNDQYGPVLYINELEYINGYVYANQWRTDTIYKIDPKTGHVIGVIDMKNFRAQVGIPEPAIGDETAPEVMNGIAYDVTGNRIFITGKNWPKLFEVKLDN